MRRTMTRTGTLVSLAMALVAGCGDEKPEPKAKEIPLKSIYVSFDQKGIVSVERDEGKLGERFTYISGKAPSGASNLFLVRGKTIDDAIKATTQVLSGGASADSAVPYRGAQGSLTGSSC